MAVDRRGVRGIRTMAAMTDQRRTRTSAGALLELSALANEKLLLEREVARATRRGTEIRRRLEEIATKERRLMKIVETGELPPATAPAVGPAGSASAPEARALSPTLSEGPQDTRLKLSEFSY